MVPTRPMKLLLTSLALATLTFTQGSADIPKKTPLYTYATLWTDSPFTSKPPPVETTPTLNPLNDFTLTGIAPVPGGYRVTIISKKDPSVKEIIEPGGKGPFQVISVDRNPGKNLGTTVVLSSGSMQGTVSFEPELISLNAAPPAPQQQNPQNPQPPTPASAPNQGNQNLPPGVANPAQNSQTPQNPAPRPRIVSPAPQPTTGNTDTNNRTNRVNRRSENRTNANR